MRIAVVSDIHANGDALDAVAREIARRRPDRVVHLGDLVGYNAEPERCVAWAAENAVDGVMGNHDAVACGKSGGETFNRPALEAARWSAARLSPGAAAFLSRLPDRLAVGDGVLLVHGAPSDPDRYLFRLADAEEEMQAFPEEGAPRVVFFGHTHVPAAFVREPGGPVAPGPPGGFRLAPGHRAMLNPGSVGQPRDRDPRASFLIFDTDTGEASWIRVPYDVKACQAKVIAAGLPRFFAARLSEGT
ncbi:MAG: metallophosphoesterase family protein [Gemmatimonadota bacterium]